MESVPQYHCQRLSSLWTHASDMGIGIYFNGELFAEPVTEGHICYTELWALNRALDILEDKVQPGVLTWKLDNSALLAPLRSIDQLHHGSYVLSQ